MAAGAPRPGDGLPLRSLMLPVILPAFLMATGSGALNTFLPLYLTSLGCSAAQAALLVGVGTAGILLLDLPSGFVVARYGERRVLVASSAAMVGSVLIIAAAPGPALVTVGMFLANASATFWLLGRLEFMRKALAVSSRGRGLAMVGGVMRAGLLLGPLLGGVAAQASGYRVVFLGTAALAAASLATFLAAPDGGGPERRTALPMWSSRALRDVLGSRGRALATAGVSMLVLSMVRSGRSLLLPLWGEHIGLDAAGVGLVVGLSSAGDTLMFYPAGLVSDRKGRKWSAVICMLTLSLGMALVPLARTLASFVLAAVFIGIGNGMGSGINMTLGADFASGADPGVFLGVWRLVSDLGTALSPLLIGVVTGALALAPAAVIIAVVGAAGGAFHAALVPETGGPRAGGRGPGG